MAVTVSNRIKYRMATLLEGYTIRAWLLNGYTPNPDHNVGTDLTNEISGNGYVRVTVSGLLSTQDDTNNLGALDSADISFGAVGPFGGQAITHLALVRRLGGGDVDATDEIIAVYDCAATLNGGVFTAVVATTGLMGVA